MAESMTDVISRTANAVESQIGAVFADLQTIAAELTTVASGIPFRPERKQLAFIEERFRVLILKHQGLIDGGGIAYEPGALSDAVMWLEWWRLRGEGNPKFIGHDFNPASIRYYDYPAQDWFIIPSLSGQATAIGPYVDIDGINVNTVTLTVPAITSIGTHVLGCDVSLAALEKVFLRALRTRDRIVALVGSNDRVIASNSASYTTGTLVDAVHARTYAIHAGSSNNSYDLPWRLITTEVDSRD